MVASKSVLAVRNLVRVWIITIFTSLKSSYLVNCPRFLATVRFTNYSLMNFPCMDLMTFIWKSRTVHWHLLGNLSFWRVGGLWNEPKGSGIFTRGKIIISKQICTIFYMLQRGKRFFTATSSAVNAIYHQIACKRIKNINLAWLNYKFHYLLEKVLQDSCYSLEINFTFS